MSFCLAKRVPYNWHVKSKRLKHLLVQATRPQRAHVVSRDFFASDREICHWKRYRNHPQSLQDSSSVIFRENCLGNISVKWLSMQEQCAGL
jgi:hypothetical protein